MCVRVCCVFVESFDIYLNNVLTRPPKKNRWISCRRRQNAASQKEKKPTFYAEISIRTQRKSHICTRYIQIADEFNIARHWIWLLNVVWSILMWFVSLNMIRNWHTKSSSQIRVTVHFFFLRLLFFFSPFEFIQFDEFESIDNVKAVVITFNLNIRVLQIQKRGKKNNKSPRKIKLPHTRCGFFYRFCPYICI